MLSARSERLQPRSTGRPPLTPLQPTTPFRALELRGTRCGHPGRFPGPARAAAPSLVICGYCLRADPRTL